MFYIKNAVLKESRKGLQAFRFATLLKDTPTQVFPVNIVKFLRAPILKNICERLLFQWYEMYLTTHVIFYAIWDRLYNLKTWKHVCRSVTFSKVTGFYAATLLKVTLHHRSFSRFYKLYQWYQIAQRITYDHVKTFEIFSISFITNCWNWLSLFSELFVLWDIWS